MKVIINENQYKFLFEQRSDFAMDRQSNAILQSTGIRNQKDYNTVNQVIKSASKTKIDPHTLMSIFAVGTAFIPFVGPLISAGIGLADAGLYYQEGDKKSAGVTAVLSMMPFVGSAVSKIPGIKELGAKGMAALASKLTRGGSLNKIEQQIVNSFPKNFEFMKGDLSAIAKKLKGLEKQLEYYRPGFVNKYGEEKYRRLLYDYTDNIIDKNRFLKDLKTANVTSNIKLKPILGAGADHKIFQSSTNPNVIFKAEIRPGEVDKWYDTFKKYPNIFPKTFNKTNVLAKDGTKLQAVVMEKLNTSQFENFWNELETITQKIQNGLPPSKQKPLEFIAKGIKNPEYMNIWNNTLGTLKKQKPDLVNKIDEFNKMIQELYKIVPNPDIRKFNFGYDGKGILKSLDL